MRHSTTRFCLLAAVLLPLLARAHDEFLSLAKIWSEGTAWVLEVNLDPFVSEGFFQGKTEDPFYRLDPENLEPVRAILEEKAKTLFRVEEGGQVLVPESAGVRVVGDNLFYTIRYPRHGGDELTLTHQFMAEVREGHRTVLAVVNPDGTRGGLEIFEAGHLTLSMAIASPEPDPLAAAEVATEAPEASPEAAPLAAAEDASPPTVRPTERRSWFSRAFFILGIEHIALGFDHLLFLGGLLVVCRRWKDILTIVTSFTLAHSITLTVAALDLWNLPGRIVEPAIAASIIFVGVENLARKEVGRGRAWLTFAFGLIHGFGFASVLREIGLGTDGGGVVAPLLAFNVGIELGQLTIVALVLPVFWALQKRPVFERWLMPVWSGAIVLMGAFWLVQRTVL